MLNRPHTTGGVPGDAWPGGCGEYIVMMRHTYSSMYERRYRGYRQSHHKKNTPIETLRTVLSDCFMILGIVSALSFIDYFHSSADVASDVFYYACHYDDIGVKRDFLKYGLIEPFNIAHRLRPSYTVLSRPLDYGPDNPVDSFLLRTSRLQDMDSVSSIVRFRFKGECMSNNFGLPGAITNSEFWENEFFDSLSRSVDSTTLFEALMIVIAHRQVYTGMVISNNGLQDARSICVYLQPPVLINPRELQANGRVTFLRIDPEYSTDQVRYNGDNAVIDIPYIRAGEQHLFIVVSSMQNLARNNIYVTYETEKSIILLRFIVILAIVAGLYWSVFLYLWYKHRS